MQIEWATFQPFGSRDGQTDFVYAVKLRGHKWKQIRQFKAALRTFEAMRRGDGTLSKGNAGGWLAFVHRWFVEPAVWQDMLAFWDATHIPVVEVQISMEILLLEGKRYEYQAGLKYNGDGDPIYSIEQYEQRMAKR